MPADLPLLYCSAEDLDAILSEDGQLGRVDDDAAGELTSDQEGYVTKALNWATDRVNFYLEGRYTRADLSQSWLVNDWATILTCYKLSTRRGNPAPGSLKDLYDEAIEDMKAVKRGEQDLPGAGPRTNAWPAWSNIRTNALYELRKVRVETPISEQTPLPGRRNRDVTAPYIIEPG